MRAVPAIGLVVACRQDSGPAPAPTLQRVILSPAAAYVVIGATQQFTVRGLMSDGSTEAVAVTYAATGGTIASDGSYRAGILTGTYRLVAIQSGGTLSDTAEITLTPAGSRTYTTSFPLTENPISEGGRWIGGGTVGLDWTNVSTTPGLAIGHQSGVRYSDATAILTGTWGPDQRASATVYTVAQKDACYQELELRLRSEISAHVNRGYEVSYRCSQTSSAYLIIVRWNGALGDFTYLFNQSGAQYGIKTGDVISASIVGVVITASKNGVELARVTDGTFATGSPGMGFNLETRDTSCATTSGDYGFSSYTATDAAVAQVRPGPNSHTGIRSAIPGSRRAARLAGTGYPPPGAYGVVRLSPAHR